MSTVYTIGSFNLLNLTFSGKGEESKDYATIARIINNEGFDVVALQEVPSKMAVETVLLSHLGKGKWDAKWDQPPSISNKAREGYAYVWRKDKLRLVDVPNKRNPFIDEQYKINGLSVEGRLIRPPFVIRLTPLGTIGGIGFELRLINTHITFGKPVLATDMVSNEQLRLAEFKVLSEQIYPRIATLPLGNGNTSAYTILLGDYNLVISGPGYKIDKLVEVDFKNPKRRRNLLTVQEEKTSLKQAKGNELRDDEETVEEEFYTGGDIYSKNYDHFSFDAELKEKMIINDSRVEAVGYVNNDLQKYRISVSDHVPIKLMINLRTKG